MTETISTTTNTYGLSKDELLEIDDSLRLTRTLEERLVALFRQTKVIGGLYRSLDRKVSRSRRRTRSSTRKATSSSRSSPTSPDACRRRTSGAEFAARIAEKAFDYLDAPIKRVASLDVPTPYSPPLEAFYLPNKDKVIAAARELLAY